MHEEKKYSIFHLEGGLGKHVAATAVAKCIKNNHQDRELVIICAYPEIFINLPYVDRVYRIGNTPYFYNDFIKDCDSIMFKHEPYFTTEHIKKEMDLITNWCNLYNLKYTGEEPELIFNIRQKQLAHNKWKRDRPVLVLQTNGGPLQEQPYPYSWARDLPYDVASAIANAMKDKYHIIQICRHEANILPNVEVVMNPMSNMELFGLLLHSEKRILIDSCLQHAAKALNLDATVLWVATSPDVFGYDIHNNIVANLPDNPTLPDSYLFDYNFTGEIHECPIIDEEVFNIPEVLDNI